MSIDFGRSFAFIADDPRWLPKLSAIAAFTTVTSVLVLGPIITVGLAAIPREPVEQVLAQLAAEDPRFADVQIPYVAATPQLALLVLPFGGGLAGLALLLGYYIELVRNVRLHKDLPLPAWDDWGDKLKDGFIMQAAYLGYLLANVIFFAVGLFLIRQIDGMNAELIRLTLALCCLIPLVFINGLVIIFLTSISVLPYSVGGRFSDFYRLGWVWRRIQQDTRLTGQWFAFGLLANLGFGAAQSLPVVGILASVLSLFMSVTVQGHLLGQYGAALDEKHGNALDA